MKVIEIKGSRLDPCHLSEIIKARGERREQKKT